MILETNIPLDLALNFGTMIFGAGAAYGVLKYRSVRNGNGLVGDKSAEYWKSQYREITADVLRPYLDSNAKALGDIRDGVNKLVTLFEAKL